MHCAFPCSQSRTLGHSGKSFSVMPCSCLQDDRLKFVASCSFLLPSPVECPKFSCGTSYHLSTSDYHYPPVLCTAKLHCYTYKLFLHSQESLRTLRDTTWLTLKSIDTHISLPPCPSHLVLSQSPTGLGTIGFGRYITIQSLLNTPFGVS